MTDTRSRLSDADQAVTAVMNCITAVTLGFMEAGQIDAANKVIDAFDELNDQLLPPGHYRDWLKHPVNAHRLGLKSSGLADG